MRVLFTLLVLVVGLGWWASEGQAAVLDQLVTVATKHWGGQPRCGKPQPIVADLRPIGAFGAVLGQDDCRVWIDKRPYGLRSHEEDLSLLCVVVVHEVGHLVLGPAFPENVDDPWHSLDPDNVMSEYGGIDTPDCLRWAHKVVAQRKARAEKRRRHT